MPSANRRPIAVRSSGWAQRIARVLARSKITPNQISCLSVLFALLGAYALPTWPDWHGMLLCAICILLRLLCNLFDGMVAVEGGRGTATGSLYNEVPDRIADVLFLLALGFVVNLPWLGWLNALLAVLTAYIRLLGDALGQAQDFRGPMAKPHRMWLMGLMLVPAALLPDWSHRLLLITAIIIATGSALTCVLRLHAIARRLKDGSA
ncbi:CDP-alcohol phosphatidyltransferase family protein [Dyella psychrodurans]|uniref:CDP-alcohol phosphatidyltransferase family protein n=1 Tax=Dyella psychrodurans TaxID=1927960 RepID=A0A370XBK2_9GAMM|nr:CDP-alcohol phosphatidyltransferase family protein [Dyella psychrodurans]RDS85647.1 CDP-alcohol phosphatidyltransferase family protein [Dyella psychrodurans]